jgi:hypothetical protein
MQRDVNAQTRTTRCKERQTKGPATRDDDSFTSGTLIGVCVDSDLVVYRHPGFAKATNFT